MEVIRSPSSITLLSEDEVVWSGVRYPSDALRLVPGLEVQRVYSTLSNVAVRGFNDSPAASQGVMGLINGRQVYNEYLGNVLWDQLMLIPDDIKQVEVIRGPSSFLYGPNAMHGLVNFVTRAPLEYDESELLLSTAFGTYGSNISQLKYVKRDLEADSGLVANLVYDDIDDFQPRGDDTRNKIYGDLHFEQALGPERDPDTRRATHRFELSGGVSDQELDLLIPTLDLFLPGVTPLPMDNLASETQEVFLSGKYVYDDLEAKFSWTGFDSSLTPEFGIYQPFDVNLDTLDVDVQYSFGLMEDHDLTTGVGFRYATFDTENVDVSGNRDSTNLVWGFLQDEIELDENLELTAGLRVDGHSTAGANVSPRAALVWKAAENHSLRASYGTGFRNPSLREISFNMTVNHPVVGPIPITGNEDLEAEKLESFEIGYRGWFRNENLRLGITAFENHIEDLVEFESVGGGVVAPRNQEEEQKVRGIEIDSEYTFSEWFTAFGNYSYNVRENRVTGQRIPITPRNKANLGVRFGTPTPSPEDVGEAEEGPQLFGGATRPVVEGMLWLTYFDDTEYPFPNGFVDEYTMLNGSINYNFLLGGTKSSVFLKGFNITNNKHREHPEGDEYGAIVQLGVSLTW